MPLFYGRSDAYYEERDRSASPSGVEPSAGALVYASRRGPLERTLFTTPDQFINRTGKPDPSVSLSPYCGLAFLAYSRIMYGVRAIGSGYSFGGVALQKRTAQVPELRADSQPDPRPLSLGGQDVDWAHVGAATSVFDNLLYFYADGPGSYSKGLAVEIVSDNLQVPANVQAFDASTVGPLIAGIDVAAPAMAAIQYDYKVTAINDTGETIASNSATVTLTVAGVATYVQWDLVPGALGYRIYGRTGGQFELIDTVGGGQSYYLDYGVFTPSGAPPSTQTFTDEFLVRVYDDEESTSTPVETFQCGFRDSVNGLGEQLEVMEVINGKSDYIRVASNVSQFLTLPVIYSLGKTYFAAGNSGTALLSSDVSRAWELFRDEEQADVRLLINGGFATPTVQRKMLDIARSRQDCVAILDVPATRQTAQLAMDYRNITLNVNTNRGALYSPDLRIQDQWSGKLLYVPPSGHIAAVYANTDNVAYPWFAPAGLRRGQLDVLALRYKYNKGERDLLKARQICYARDMPGLGIAVWEQRTLQGTLSALSFMNVRRLLDYLQLIIRRVQIQEEFEPNDEFTRTTLRLQVEEILEAIKRTRGINKYLVICDKRNNPAIETANGQLRIDAFIEATLPAETIIFRAQVTKQDADFTELVTRQGIFS